MSDPTGGTSRPTVVRAAAFRVAGWWREAVRADLQIETAPREHGPLAPEPGFRPWEPWPPNHAADRVLAVLREVWPDDAGDDTNREHQQEAAAP